MLSIARKMCKETAMSKPPFNDDSTARILKFLSAWNAEKEVGVGATNW